MCLGPNWSHWASSSSYGCPWLDIAISTTDLHAAGLLMENTSAEMSPVARQANTGNLGGRKPEHQQKYNKCWNGLNVSSLLILIYNINRTLWRNIPWLYKDWSFLHTVALILVIMILYLSIPLYFIFNSYLSNRKCAVFIGSPYIKL